MGKVEDVKQALSGFQEMLLFEETPQWLIIRTRQFLGSEDFAKIATIVRGFGGEYISAGNSSHFRVPQQTALSIGERLNKLLPRIKADLEELQAINKEMEMKKENGRQ